MNFCCNKAALQQSPGPGATRLLPPTREGFSPLPKLLPAPALGVPSLPVPALGAPSLPAPALGAPSLPALALGAAV